MNERGLWELFWITGLPAAWLALAGEREAEQVQTAFRPAGGKAREV